MRYSVDGVIEKINLLEDSKEDKKIRIIKKAKQGLSISLAFIIINFTIVPHIVRKEKMTKTDETYYSNQLVISEEEKQAIEEKLGRKVAEDENTIILSGISTNSNLTENEKNLFYEFANMLKENPYIDKEKGYEALKNVDIVYEENTEDYGYYNKIIGIYSKKDNQIKVFTEDCENNVKYHEITHCIFSTTDNINLPQFFIEGVTELLTNEYFSTNPFVEVTSYPYEITMVKMLADIVGSDVILKAYSKGDISFLKEELKNKMPNIDVDNLLKNIDDTFFTYESKNIIEKDKLKEIIKEFDSYYFDSINNQEYSFEHTLYEYNRGILSLLFCDSPNASYIEYLTENGYYTKTYFSKKLKNKCPEIKKKNYSDNFLEENVAKKYEKII